jgi:hypothetical protein
MPKRVEVVKLRIDAARESVSDVLLLSNEADGVRAPRNRARGDVSWCRFGVVPVAGESSSGGVGLVRLRSKGRRGMGRISGGERG